ncbi:tRNA N(3)-methylcytidine methyltransferase METTL8, mitochondrial isoform X2 [Leuresthes tenuis]|uniref:tRNA N(3)-methylcytidine methyltransferase METTL8, mitochondrial isoform X2 n=1 Tax=Leuresthes tenuis TaxID=355514 RepID=UPI003B50944E
MYKKWSFSVAKVATAFIRLSMRLKSSDVRPSAPLGSRILTSVDDIFKHNMWDHVQWTEEDKENARQKVQENSSVQLPLTEQGKFDTDACQYWDTFYQMHQDKFFKDRRWLFLEFPELLPSHAEDQATETLHAHQQKAALQHNEAAFQTSTFPGQDASFRILEVGCGVGNSVFPIVNNIKGTNSFLYCCDFSPRAIQLVKDHPDYHNSMCHAFVHDICEEMASFPFPQQSLDVILAVFVLSSIHPDRVQGVVNRLSACLKHGGIFLFRDYGKYDFSQLRFKKGRCLSENFYTRGDGTCVYYFTKAEIHDLFSKAGLEEVQNLEDRRLQVNRGKKVTMRRVWMQSKYRKPHSSP